MKLIELNWNPTPRQLKQFGVGALIFLPLIGWLATGKPRSLADANVPVLGGLAVVGLAIAIAALVKPGVIKPLFIGVSLITLPIGLAVGEVVLLAVFFGVFLPIGLVMRLIGRDALQRKLDPGAKSYWQPKAQPSSSARYFQQF